MGSSYLGVRNSPSHWKQWNNLHQGAFGLGLPAENIDAFIAATNEALKDMQSEPVYYVDYIYEGGNVDPEQILGIAEMDKFYGKDIQESLIAVQNLKVTANMVTLMSADKNPTLKISLPNGVSIIKFSSSQEEYAKLATEGFTEIELVGTCNCNLWNGNRFPQIMMKDYEIVDSCKYYF